MRLSTSLILASLFAISACAAGGGDSMDPPPDAPQPQSSARDASPPLPPPAVTVDAAAPPDAAPPEPQPPPPPVDAAPRLPTWQPLGGASRHVAVGCCSSSSTGDFQCNPETVGTEIRVSLAAERKSSAADKTEYGWLQGTSVAINGDVATITGQSGCGCDALSTEQTTSYVCSY